MIFGIIAAVICLVLECFVFYINVWHLTGKDYTQKELELQNAIISNGGETKVVIDAADETNSEYIVKN